MFKNIFQRVKTIAIGLGLVVFLSPQSVSAAAFQGFTPILTMPTTFTYLNNYAWSNLFLQVPTAMKTKYKGYYQPQPGNIRTFAGDGNTGTLNTPYAVALDEANNLLYYTDTAGYAIYQLDLDTDEVKRIAGSESVGNSTGTVTATSGSFGWIKGMALHPTTGDLFIADYTYHKIRKITLSATTPQLSTVVGTGTGGNSTSGTTATSAMLNQPYDVAFNNFDTMYIADKLNHCIKWLSKATGRLYYASGTTCGTSGNTTTKVSNPYSIAFDSTNHLYIADGGNNRIVKRVGVTLTKIAGSSLGTAGYTNSVFGASSSRLSGPYSLDISSSGDLYFSEFGNNVIRKIVGASATGAISTVAGTKRTKTTAASYAADATNQENISATSASTTFNWPLGIAVSSSNDIYFADSVNHRIRRVEGKDTKAPEVLKAKNIDLTHVDVLFSEDVVDTDGTSDLVAANFAISGGLTVTAVTKSAASVYRLTTSLQSAGTTYTITVSSAEDTSGAPHNALSTAYNATTAKNNNKVTFKPLRTGDITTVVGFDGNFKPTDIQDFGNGGPSYYATLNSAFSVKVDGSGNIYISESGNNCVRKVDATTNNISVYAGTCDSAVTSNSGDGGAATSAKFSNPTDMEFMNDGTILLVDKGNDRVRQFDASNTVTPFAGSGTAGSAGDGLDAIYGELNAPSSVAVDSLGNVYIADTSNNSVRKVSTTGVITKHWSATSAAPTAVAVDSADNVYVATANRIKKITGTTTSTNYAGTGVNGYTGDNGLATSARIHGSGLAAMAFDSSDNLYFIDDVSHVVRVINKVSAKVSKFAGISASAGFSGDGGAATSAKISSPSGLDVDDAGNVYIVDSGNGVIRKVIDPIKPKVESATFIDATHVDVVYSENVSNSAGTDLTTANFSSTTLTISAVSKVLGNTYRLTTNQISMNVSHTITANASVIDAVGNTVETSAKTASFTRTTNAAPEFTGVPVLVQTGLAVGDTASLTSTGTTDADGDTVTLSYQWKAGGISISGATSSTFVITATQKHKDISCTVTASDGEGGSASVTTAAVPSVNTAPRFTGTPTISTNRKVGDYTGTYSKTTVDADGDARTLSYQWESSDTSNGTYYAIGGANTSYYYPTSTEAHKYLRCKLTVTDGQGGSTRVNTAGSLIVNTNPIGYNDSFTIDEDASANSPYLLANDVDTDGDVLSVSSVASTSDNGGTVSGALSIGSFNYTPPANFTGTDIFRYNVSDGNGGSSTGAVVVTVNAVNDAPVDVNSTINAAESFTEDTTLNLTNLVISDVDNASTTATLTLSDTNAGVLSTTTSGAVTSTFNTGTGVWSANGAIASVNTLLAGVSYVPAADFNSDFTIAVNVSDGYAEINGNKVFTATPVNDAPVLNTATVNVTSIDEDNTTASGDQVSALVAGKITDVDGVAQSAIAVTAAVNTNGSWQYSTDNGATWIAIGTVSNTSALLLPALGKLRFVPNANWFGTATISYRAWDKTSGTAGTKVNVSNNGGTTAFSTGLGVMQVTVNSINDAPTFIGTPSITQASVVVNGGLSLSATATTDVDTADTISLTYQWQAGGVDIVNATSAILTVGAAQAHQAIVCVVTASDGNGGVVVAQTAAVTPSNSAPSFNGTPIINAGTYRVGVSTLSIGATAASDIDNDTLSTTYQWQSSADNTTFADLTGATGATLVLNATHAHKFIRVVLLVDDNHGSTTAATTTSITVGNSTPAFLATPTIAGVAAVGNTLDALNNAAIDADGDPVATTYQWKSNNVDIAAATSASFTVTSAQAHSTLTLLVTLDDGTGLSADTYTHAVTTVGVAVSNTAPVFTGSPTITGTPSVGSVLSVGTTGTSDVDGDTVTLSYQWKSGVTNVGTNSSSYTLVLGDKGKAISCVVTASDGTVNTLFTTSSVTIPNSAPIATNTNVGQTYTEDTPLALTAIVVSDADDTSVTVTLTLSDAAVGSLSTATSTLVTSTFNAGTGVWSASGLIVDVNTLLSGVVFTPVANGASGFTIAVSISDGVATILDSKVITGTAVNDAPVVTNAAVSLSTIVEDSAPAGDQIATLMGGSITDVDGVNLSVAVTGVVDSYGVWQFSTDSGVNWTGLSSVTVADTYAMLLGGLDKVRFVPQANWSGSASIDVYAWDQSAGVAGSYVDASIRGGATAFSSTGSVASITVSAVNDAPVLNTNGGLTIAEDAVLTTIGSAQLSSSDLDNTVAEIQYTVSLLPSLGTLKRNGVVMTQGSVFTQADIDLNQVSYTANANANGSDSIQLSLSDVAGAPPQLVSFGITITAVNDAPVQTNNVGLTLNEDAGATLIDSALLLASDVDNTSGQLTYTVNPLPTGGVLSLNGVAMVLNGTFTQDQVDLNRLRYKPDADVNGVDTFGFTVSDGGLTVTNNYSITVVAVNDAPTFIGTPAIVQASAAFGQPLSLVNTATNDIDGDVVTLTYQWLSNGNPVAVGGIAATYTPTALDVGNVISCVINASDANGGISRFTTASLSVGNQAPVLVLNTGLVVSEDASLSTITNAMLQVTDVDNATAQRVYTLISAPVNGGLYQGGVVTLVNGDSFTQQDVDNNLIAYLPLANKNTSVNGLDNFVVSVVDAAGATLVDNTGATLSSIIFGIDIVAVNDVPSAMSISSASLNENNIVGAVIASFGVTDVDVGDTHSYSLVAGTGSTDNASFAIVGNQLKANIVFNFEVKSSYAIRVRVTDVAGGTFEQALTINVNNVNEAPTSINNGLNVSVVTQQHQAIDVSLPVVDQDVGDTYTYVATQPVHGTTSLTNTGKVHYQPDNFFVGSDSFALHAKDAGNLVSPNITVTVDVQQDPTQESDMSLTLDMTSNVIASGAPVSFAGKLSPAYSGFANQLNGQPVLVNVRSLSDSYANSDPYGNAKTFNVPTDPYGNYVLTDVYAFASNGEYSIAATFAGVVGKMKATESKPKIALVGASAGYVVMVGGKISNNEGLASHEKTLNRAYSTLLDRGFDKQNIRYFSYESTNADVYAQPSKAGIQDAIENWVVPKMNSVAAPLYLIMVDHGSPSLFYISPETINPTELDGWLDTLETKLNAQALAEKRVIIYGACYSGTFIADLKGNNRVVVASAASDEESYKGPLENDDIRSGEYFIEALFNRLGKGESFGAAFTSATEETEQYTRRGGSSTNSVKGYNDEAAQHPLIDADGDGVATNDLTVGSASGDAYAAASLYLGKGISYATNAAYNPAEIKAVTNTIYLNATTDTYTLWAEVNNELNASSVWIEVHRPEDVLVPQNGISQLSTNYLREFMGLNLATGLREINYNQFTTPGLYEIFYYTRDKASGKVSPMQRSMVYKDILNNSAPAAFDLKSPIIGSSHTPTMIFDWFASADADGDTVKYTITVGTDAALTQVIYNKNEIRTPLHAVDGTGLFDQYAQLFWRVEAMDQYGLRTASTSTYSFKPISTNVVVTSIVQGYTVVSLTGQIVGNQTITIDGKTVTSNADGSYAVNLGQPTAGYLLNGVVVEPGVSSFNVDVPPSNTINVQPILTLKGDATVSIEAGRTYNDAGATAADTEDGNISNDITKTGGVDTSVLGTYTITYGVKDAQGLAAVPISRTVKVIDTTGPLVTVPADIYKVAASSVGLFVVNIGTATASDLFPPITISNNAPAKFAVGTTLVTWQATDANGITAVGSQSVVLIDPSTIPAKDTVPPFFTQAPKNIILIGDAVTGGVLRSSAVIQAFLASAKASDLVDGGVLVTHDMANLIPSGQSTVVKFFAKDIANNIASVSATITVNNPKATGQEAIAASGTGLTIAQSITLGLDPNATVVDVDADGINDIDEIGDPLNPNDSDGDGLPDLFESGSNAKDASLASGLATLSGLMDISSVGESLSKVSISDAVKAPADVAFPYGVLDYSTTVKSVGATQKVTLKFGVPLPTTPVLYKVDTSGIYHLWPASVWQKVDANTISLTLTDGDALTDLDGVANGVIHDPVAIGELIPSKAAGNSAADSTASATTDTAIPSADTGSTTPVAKETGGGGGGGGCINTVHQGNINYLLLMALFMSLGLRLFRRGGG